MRRDTIPGGVFPDYELLAAYLPEVECYFGALALQLREERKTCRMQPGNLTKNTDI